MPALHVNLQTVEKYCLRRLFLPCRFVVLTLLFYLWHIYKPSQYHGIKGFHNIPFFLFEDNSFVCYSNTCGCAPGLAQQSSCGYLDWGAGLSRVVLCTLFLSSGFSFSLFFFCFFFLFVAFFFPLSRFSSSVHILLDTCLVQSAAVRGS